MNLILKLKIHNMDIPHETVNPVGAQEEMFDPKDDYWKGESGTETNSKVHEPNPEDFWNELKAVEEDIKMEAIHMKDLEELIKKGEIIPEESYAFGLWTVQRQEGRYNDFNRRIKRFGFKEIDDAKKEIEENEKRLGLTQGEHAELDGIRSELERSIEWLLQQKKTIVFFLPEDLFTYTRTNMGLTAAELFFIMQKSHLIDENIYLVRGAYEPFLMDIVARNVLFPLFVALVSRIWLRKYPKKAQDLFIRRAYALEDNNQLRVKDIEERLKSEFGIVL